MILSLVFGVGIGMIMAALFHREELARAPAVAGGAEGDGITRRTALFLAVLVALLIGGTLKVDLLTTPWWGTELPMPAASAWQAGLDRMLPVDTLRGEEGLTLQGAVLIGLLGLIGVVSLRGLRQVDRGFNQCTFAALGLIALTLVFAAVGIAATPTGLRVQFTGRTVVVLLLMASLVPLARRFEAWDVQQWLWESWRFVRQIFPLLVVGVFVVGVIRVFIRPEWVQAVAGDNTLAGNLVGVGFGVFMYFPTLVEVPVAKMFLSLGMHPGPLLAYIMADPELSLQSMLITAAIIGRRKTATYVALVALFATVSGLAYGAWTDGEAPWQAAVAVAMVLATWAGLQAWRRRGRPVPA